MKGFIEFVRDKGVVGLAVGFILGGAVAKVVTSLVGDIIDPLLGVVLGAAKGLDAASVKVGAAEVTWGHFVGVLIDFLIVALVVYFGVTLLKLDQLDEKVEK